VEKHFKKEKCLKIEAKKRNAPPLYRMGRPDPSGRGVKTCG